MKVKIAILFWKSSCQTGQVGLFSIKSSKKHLDTLSPYHLWQKSWVSGFSRRASRNSNPLPNRVSLAYMMLIYKLLTFKVNFRIFVAIIIWPANLKQINTKRVTNTRSLLLIWTGHWLDYSRLIDHSSLTVYTVSRWGLFRSLPEKWFQRFLFPAHWGKIRFPRQSYS